MEDIRTEKLRLEMLSDKARQGIPINFIEAMAVIEYRTALQLNRQKSIFQRVKEWFRRGNKIKNCPFCGGEAHPIKEPNGKYIVGCMMVDCPVEPCTPEYDTLEEAIEAWNQRL